MKTGNVLPGLLLNELRYAFSILASSWCKVHPFEKDMQKQIWQVVLVPVMWLRLLRNVRHGSAHSWYGKRKKKKKKRGLCGSVCELESGRLRSGAHAEPCHKYIMMDECCAVCSCFAHLFPGITDHLWAPSPSDPAAECHQFIRLMSPQPYLLNNCDYGAEGYLH